MQQRDLTLQELYCVFVYKRLQKYLWNRTHAAKSLDISVRGLRSNINRLKKMGVKVPDNPKRGYSWCYEKNKVDRSITSKSLIEKIIRRNLVKQIRE
jgi:hypothetical protein